MKRRLLAGALAVCSLFVTAGCSDGVSKKASDDELNIMVLSHNTYSYQDNWWIWDKLQEETGIKLDTGELQLILTHRGKSAFVDIYLAHKDVPAEQLTMQPGETTDARWVTFSEFERMIGDGLVPSPVCRRYAVVKYILINKI